MRVLLLIALFWTGALVAQAHGDKDHSDEETDTAELSGISLPENLSYHEHARPIIEASCVGCHSAGQIAGYAPFTAAEDVVWAAPDIKFHVVKRLMPPWMPSRANLPLKNDLSLSDEEIAILAAWADEGAPLGDPQAYAPAATDEALIAEVRADLVLQLEEAYRPAEELQDDYRCFAFELDIKAPQFITGYEFIPDVSEMAHHNLVYRFDARANPAIESRDYADGKPGWTCYGGTGLGRGGEAIAGWAPGAAPILYPAGAGFLIKPGQHIVVQMHYNLGIARKPDRSRIVLQLESADSERAELVEYPLLAPVEIPCPGEVAGPQCEREAAIKRVGDLYGEEARRAPDRLLRECGQSLADYADSQGEQRRGILRLSNTRTPDRIRRLRAHARAGAQLPPGAESGRARRAAAAAGYPALGFPLARQLPIRRAAAIGAWRCAAHDLRLG